MLSFIAVIALNLAPIQNIHLETPQGKEQFVKNLEQKGNELKQKWDSVHELQKKLDEAIVKLQPLPQESAEARALASETQMLTIQWQAATQGLPELAALVEAGVKGLKELDRVIHLVRSFEQGKDISSEDQEFLQKIATLCEKN